MPVPRIIIVGGGLAGLAAANALALHGLPGTVLESRPRLGGRASSFFDTASQSWVDNCQHVNLGCGTNFRHFCHTTGIEPSFRIEPELLFCDRQGRLSRLASGPWPAPFHLTGSLLRLKYLTLWQKWRLAWGVRALAHRRLADSEECLLDWLRRHRQPPEVIERFWQPVLVSALSSALHETTVAAGRKVLVDAFLAHREGWLVHLPTQPLDELYSHRVVQHLQEQGVTVQLQAGVTRLLHEGDRTTGVQLQSGEILPADAVIVAVPPNRLRDLLPEPWREWPAITAAQQIVWTAITSVHLWWDRRILEQPHLVLLDRLSQWVFHRGSIAPVLPQDEYLYQVVISASHALERSGREALIAAVVSELREFSQAAREAQVLKSRVVTEHKATISVAPGQNALRPEQGTPSPNLFLAGDWTRTGWPSTMEGAVRSGYLAAEGLLNSLGRPARCLQPGLSASFWSRALLGI